MTVEMCYNEIYGYPHTKENCIICGKWYKSFTPDKKGVCSEECFEAWEREIESKDINNHYNYYY